MSDEILLVEDEPNVADLVIFNLEAEGYIVHHAADIDNAEKLLNEDPHLILLDVMLPDGNGYEFAESLRKNNNHTPIIMLTARDTQEDIIEGLKSGADDYCCKPFNLDELLARIEAQLRRNTWGQKPRMERSSDSLNINGVTVNLVSGIMSGRKNSTLTDIELKLLNFFNAHLGAVLSRDEIMLAVWDAPNTVKSRTLDNFVLRLRKIFEDDPKNPTHFLTAYGSGYKFVL